MMFYVIFCVYLRIIVHFAWICLVNGVFFEKCKLDCFGCENDGVSRIFPCPHNQIYIFILLLIQSDSLIMS